MDELTFPIASRKSASSSLDNISPAMLKYLSAMALDSLLTKMSTIFTTLYIPSKWNAYEVILIAKQNSKTSFQSHSFLLYVRFLSTCSNLG